MEFISAEEFLEQNEKVKKVFLEWWKPSDGDIYWWKEDKYIDCCYNWKFIDNTDVDNLKGREIIPLLTEGQLRKFIEDNTEGKVEFYPDVYHGERYYTIMIRDSGCGGDDPEFEVDADDVLQAYWKVAIQIAKES